MGDSEYSLAFFSIILPIAYQFNPELILVTSGVGEGQKDSYGQSKISPEFFGFMVHHLKALAHSKIILVSMS